MQIWSQEERFVPVMRMLVEPYIREENVAEGEYKTKRAENLDRKAIHNL